MLVPRPQPEHMDLLEAYFATDSHKAPAELRIGIDNLRSPWGVDVTEAGIVLLTEQGGHCVSIYQRNLDGSYEKLGEVPILHPQGIGHDGQGNVYVGSRTDFTIYRFSLNDPARAVTAFKKVSTTAKSWYISVHVNRDPETGGVFISSSTNNEAANYGSPETWLPDGTKVNPFPTGFAPHGQRGGTAATYAMPARAGYRALIRGGSDIGLLLWRRKRPGDIDFGEAGYWDAAGFHRQFTDDAAKWEAEGFDLVYGPHATSSFAIDPPIGHAPWCDRFIKVCRWGEPIADALN
jgi:hypothetical protein